MLNDKKLANAVQLAYSVGLIYDIRGTITHSFVVSA